ncbi:ABC transporter permease [Eisenbergiella sp.]
MEQAQKDSPFTDEVYDRLSHLSGLEEITGYQYLPVSGDPDSTESDLAMVGFDREDMALLQSCTSDGMLPSYDKMTSQNQLVVGRAEDFEQYFHVQPQTGVLVDLKIFDGTHSQNMQFEIAAVLEQEKNGNNGDKIDMLLLPVASMKQITDCNLLYQYAVRVDDTCERQAETEIGQILSENPRLSVSTLSAAIAQNENFLQGTKLALAAAIVFIGCFSMMNLLNTIVTGILARKKEFALLRSVGMSQKQLSVMVHCEGLFIVFAGLLLSIAVGCGTGYILCGFLRNSFMSYLNYRFPFLITSLYCVFVLLCSVVFTGTELKRQSRLSMMEALK